MIVVPSTAPSSYAVSDTALAAPALDDGALASHVERANALGELCGTG